MFKKAVKVSQFLEDLKDLFVFDFAWLILVAATVVTILFITLTNFVAVYASIGLNSQIFQFSGVLLGLILTAYAIFVTLLPITHKSVIETCAFRRVNTAFIFELIAVTVLVISSILLSFLSIVPIIIYAQFWLLLVIVLWVFLLVRIFYLLFNNIRSFKMGIIGPTS